jgi:anti-sigma factor RsiW
VKSLKCPNEIIELMHAFLDGEIESEQEQHLREHLHTCKECEVLFSEFNKAIAFVRSSAHVQVSDDFTNKIMERLPKEKKRARMGRLLQRHPFLVAASVFFVLMMTSLISSWNQDHQFAVSEQKNLIVKNHTVIVPKGEVVKGDVLVQNGKLRIEGEVKGNVTVINGEQYTASAGRVTGDIKEVNQIFDWIWYHLKKTSKDIFHLFNGNEID